MWLKHLCKIKALAFVTTTTCYGYPAASEGCTAKVRACVKHARKWLPRWLCLWLICCALWLLKLDGRRLKAEQERAQQDRELERRLLKLAVQSNRSRWNNVLS